MIGQDWIEVAFVFEARPSEETLERLFDSLVSKATTPEDELGIAAWDDTGDIHHVTGTASDAAAACTDFLDSSIKIQFEGFKLRIGSGYSDGALTNVPHLTVREKIHPFTESSDVSRNVGIDERRERFVEMLSHCAETLRPTWGFGRRGGVVLPDDISVEQIQSGEMPPLFEYNYFDSRTVTSISRESVTDAPAWKVIELDSGGIFLVVREPPHSCGLHIDQCLKVSDHLGIPLFDPSNYD